MSGLSPDEVIAPVFGWSYDHIMRGEHFKSTVQNRRREMRTITIEGDDGPSGDSEPLKHGRESSRKAVTVLRYDFEFRSNELR
jgi:hypothetical protein